MREHPIEIPAKRILPPSQNHADKRNEIANYLVKLGETVGRAKVKMSSGEYTIDTILPTGGKSNGTEKRTQVVEQTRAMYCTPRHVVEAEIRARQQSDDEPQTKRRG